MHGREINTDLSCLAGKHRAMIVVFTARNSSVQTGWSLPFFPLSTWRAKQIFLHALSLDLVFWGLLFSFFFFFSAGPQVDDDFHGGVAGQTAGRRVVMVPPQLGRQLLGGITCSLSQVNRGCCIVGAPQI